VGSNDGPKCWLSIRWTEVLTQGNVKSSLFLTKYNAVKTYLVLNEASRHRNVGVMEVHLQTFLTSAVGGDDCQLHVPVALVVNKI
jgi:hypothetical protein